MAILNRALPIDVSLEHSPSFQTLLKKIKPTDQFASTRVLVELGRQDFDFVAPLFKQAIMSNHPQLQWIALRELMESTRHHSKSMKTIFQNSLHYLTGYSPTRVLIELGKQMPDTVISIFQSALASGSEQAQWAALFEISELAKIHPDFFVPLLEQSVEHEDPNLQWGAALALVKLKEEHPAHITAAINRMFSKNNLVIPVHSAKPLFNIDHDHLGASFALLKSALHSDNEELEWQAMLELIDLAHRYPDHVVPLIEEALCNENPHIQWLATLELLELSKKFPEQMAPLLENVFSGQNDAGTIATDSRVLVEVGKKKVLDVVPVLQQALHSDNRELKWAALLELMALGKMEHDMTMEFLEQFLVDQNDTTNNTRVLVELGKQNPQQIIFVLKKAIAENKGSLQHAAFRELLELIKLGIITSSSLGF